MQNLRRTTSTAWLLGFGCQLWVGCDSAVTDPAGTAIVRANGGAAEAGHPFMLEGDGTLAGQDFAPDFGPPTFGRSLFGGRCSVPSDFVIRFRLSGDASHLGRYTADLEHCTQVDFSTGRTTLSDGEATFLSADGSELWDRYERTTPGSGNAGDPEDHVFVGGTGRFESASGWAALTARCDRATGTCEVEAEGTLSYDASDRRP